MPRGGDSMRGLAVFIADIRNCKSREQEKKRINKELANIRTKFKGDKQLDGYQKKKYVCKLLFIFLLGNDVDFGHNEAVDLLASNKYTEKQIGYLFISVMMHHNHDLYKLVIQAIKNDLNSKQPVHVCLALTCIANIGTPEMAGEIGDEVPRILTAPDTLHGVKKCAALCLLRLFELKPDKFVHADLSSRLIALLSDQHLGVVTSACSLIQALVTACASEYKTCVSFAVSRLSRVSKSREQEKKRINKELANIRTKFKGDKQLDGYQKKKYVCKLLFIFLLGNDVDFGHNEAVDLLASNKYTEKQIGYLFISVMMHHNHDLYKLVIQAIKNDLNSKQPVHVCLALTCIANIGTPEMAGEIGDEVPRILTAPDTLHGVKKCAALCLLRLFELKPDKFVHADLSSRLIALLSDQHLGVVTSACSLIQALVTACASEYKTCVSFAVSRLSRAIR
eukprot:sb/3464621/